MKTETTSFQRSLHVGSFFLRGLRNFFVEIGILPFLLIFLITYFGLSEPRFLSVSNLITVSRQSVYLTILSIGQMLPILMGSFDLSVGSIITLTSITSAMVLVSYGPFLGILAGLGAAGLIGVVNGTIISVFGVSPFIVTLGTLSAAQGLALIMSSGMPIWGLPEGFLYLGSGKIGLVPVPVVITALIVIFMFVFLNWTRTGRYFYAIGGNEEAARLAGISTRFYIFFAFVLCSIFAGITGVLLTARVASGEPSLGAPLMLQCIAAVVLGGVSLRGGEGNIIGVVFGAIFIELLRNGMDLINVSSYTQMLIMGLVLIIAIVTDRVRGYYQV